MNLSLNQEDFVSLLADKGYTKKDARQIIIDVINTITECLVEGDEINFHGFGSFYALKVADRETMDYQTQTRTVVPGHRVPKFMAGKTLRRLVKHDPYGDCVESVDA